MSNYSSDLFIMIPFSKLNSKNKNTLRVKKTNKEADAFIQRLEDISEYECSRSISNKLSRDFIGIFEFVCTSDASDGNKIIGTEKCYLFLTSHINTNLYIATVMFVDIKSPVTFVLDQVSREDLIIKVNNREINLYEFFNNEFDFQICGRVKTCISLSDYPEDKREMLYFAAGEAFGSDEVNFELISRQFKSDISNNIAQFDFCDIYVSKTNIIQINKRFSKDYFDRIYYEVLLIFIAELVIFKELAIHRTNQRVIYEIEKNSKPSLSLIEGLSVEFGSTIGLWNISNFKYNAVQCLAKDIEDAFKISELMETYKNNQNYLEHIINIRNIQVSEREGKILNFIAIMLTLIQTIPLISAAYANIFGNKPSIFNSITFNWQYGLAGVIIIILIILIRKKKLERLM